MTPDPFQGHLENEPGPSATAFELEDGEVRATVVRDSDGCHLISLTPRDDSAWLPIRTCTTAYPAELIRSIFSVKGAYLCDEIMREEDPGYVEKKLRDTILMYADMSDIDGTRVLDFGCGCGSSSLVFARLFPAAQIVGVELDPRHVDLARTRARHRGLVNLTFFESPGSERLPNGIGEFDNVVLSAVFEHMLPAERRSVMPQLWACLKPGGTLFLNQTPNRLYPVDLHTTGLPVINYLPDRLALFAARRFSPRVDATESWETLLRRGIRGATLGEILRSLNASPAAPPELLRARDPAIQSFADYWLSLTTPRMKPFKRVLRVLFEAIYSLTGLAFVPPELHLAIRKPTTAGP